MVKPTLIGDFLVKELQEQKETKPLNSCALPFAQINSYNTKTSGHSRTISCRICHSAGETRGGRRRGEVCRAGRNRWHGKGGVRERLSCRETRGEREKTEEEMWPWGFDWEAKLLLKNRHCERQAELKHGTYLFEDTLFFLSIHPSWCAQTLTAHTLHLWDCWLKISCAQLSCCSPERTLTNTQCKKRFLLGEQICV